MTVGKENNEGESKKSKLVILLSVIGLLLVCTVGFFLLTKLQKNQNPSSSNSQEQFVGQAETSQQLQAECQQSANQIAGSKNSQEALAEFKKNVENCKEVYFVIEEKTKFRNEGMYPDLIVDILTNVISESANKESAFEVLNYAKTLDPWQLYMGPIVCDSEAVLAAHEESLKSVSEKICVKPEEFELKILAELKNKNFSIIEQTMSSDHVAWMGSTEASVGCPTKTSTILKTIRSASVKEVVSQEGTPSGETTEFSVAFNAGSDGDKLVLEYANFNGCLQLKAVLIPGLHTNE